MLAIVTLCTSIQLIATPAASANDVSGFRYGTDTSCGIAQGSGPYDDVYDSGCNSNVADPGGGGGQMGGYLGQVDGYQRILGCSNYHSSINPTEFNEADVNYTDYSAGFGEGLYWFGGGPGADPAYYTAYVNAGYTTPPTSVYGDTQAYDWGKKQGTQALNDQGYYLRTYGQIFLNTVFLDVEYQAGWNEVLDDQYSTSGCGGVVSTSACCTTTLDRQVINGYEDELYGSGLEYSIFSSYDMWLATFGCGNCSSGDGYIPNTNEWTFGTDGVDGPADPPIYPAPGQDGVSGWCQSNSPNNNCASFFGSITTSSSHAWAWQWSEYADSGNSVADFDQYNESRMGGL
jgi:hypothetical protein